VRWLIDAMNVIGSRPDGWWKDRHGAALRLVGMLERFAESSGDEVTVVLEQPPSPAIASELVAVEHAPRPGRDAADGEIVRRVRADAHPETLSVVTSDRGLADQVRGAGATVEPASRFRDRLEKL
jgi:uncharacterized protein YaiI (UPF0178 family)